MVPNVSKNCFTLDKTVSGDFGVMMNEILVIPGLPSLPFHHFGDPLRRNELTHLQAMVQASIMYHATLTQQEGAKQVVHRNDCSFNATLLDFVIGWVHMPDVRDHKKDEWMITVHLPVNWAKCQEFADWGVKAGWQVSAEFDWTSTS